jgi:isopenicillin-N N-acyltransferase-like protein
MLRKLVVSGSHFECGRQIGVACTDALRLSVEHGRHGLPDGLRWEDYRRAAQPYLAATEAAFPWVVDEIRGAAQGAQVDFLDLFTNSVEELFSSPPDMVGRCSDFAACAPATTTGHVLLGHNNDLSPATEDLMVAVEWHLPNQPRLFTVGVGGLHVSVAVNEAKICLTGNELSPNDERPGIPRLLLARALMAATTFEEAVAVALHPDRASSYNNLISSATGEVACVEASATDHELIYPQDGWLVHTNHYTHPRMVQYESDFQVIDGSISRYERAYELMDKRNQPVSLDLFKRYLTDHDSSPAALCRHAERVKTVFSCLIDLTAGTVDAVLGSPCQNDFEPLWAF